MSAESTTEVPSIVGAFARAFLGDNPKAIKTAEAIVGAVVATGAVLHAAGVTAGGAAATAELGQIAIATGLPSKAPEAGAGISFNA